MKIDNSYFGGFVVSKNVIDKHQPIRYSFREKSLYDKLNGWTIYSASDDDEYVANPSNFVIVNATILFTIVPVFMNYMKPLMGPIYVGCMKRVYKLVFMI